MSELPATKQILLTVSRHYYIGTSALISNENVFYYRIYILDYHN